MVGRFVLSESFERRGFFADDLEIITFLCKDMWTEVYGKQVRTYRFLLNLCAVPCTCSLIPFWH
jgi:hypothetical protein